MPSSKEVTLDEFKVETEVLSGLTVGLEPEINACAASPVHFNFIADKIFVYTTYPEAIILKSGDSSVLTSQIKKIVRNKQHGRCNYEILCGLLEECKTKVKLSRK